MNNEPVAWMWSEDGCNLGVCLDQDKQIGRQEFQDYDIPLYTHPVNPYQSITDTKIEPTIVSYTHPVKDREKDRLRFSDEVFNRWLDESISDSGHTVYDLIENVCEAWHGWENSQYYTHPVKELTLTEDEIDDVWAACSTGESDTIDMHLFAEAILKKAQEK